MCVYVNKISHDKRVACAYEQSKQANLIPSKLPLQENTPWRDILT